MQYTFKYYFKPRHSDFDDYQIAHHSKFLCWFEEARYECFEQFKGIFDVILEKYKIPVTKLECKYYHMVSRVETMVIIMNLELPVASPVLHLD